jgi:Mg/Co/Ni transporter MgtE
MTLSWQHPEEPEPFIWEWRSLDPAIQVDRLIDQMEDVLTFLAVTSVDC